jgi:hypothetical protein
LKDVRTFIAMIRSAQFHIVSSDVDAWLPGRAAAFQQQRISFKLSRLDLSL